MLFHTDIGICHLYYALHRPPTKVRKEKTVTFLYSLDCEFPLTPVTVKNRNINRSLLIN